jgi:hypothetical protein
MLLTQTQRERVSEWQRGAETCCSAFRWPWRATEKGQRQLIYIRITNLRKRKKGSEVAEVGGEHDKI